MNVDAIRCTALPRIRRLHRCTAGARETRAALGHFQRYDVGLPQLLPQNVAQRNLQDVGGRRYPYLFAAAGADRRRS